MPAFVEAMKAKPATVLPRGDDWLYELKFDGYRFLGGKAGVEVRMWSHSEKDITSRFATVAKAHSALVDRELVVADELGRPSFNPFSMRTSPRITARSASICWNSMHATCDANSWRNAARCPADGRTHNGDPLLL